jgi:acetyl-CoA acyltransferase
MGFRLRAVSLHADGDRTIRGVAEHLAVAWAKDTGADLAKTNVNGGAIAIGHPLGASGARIMATLVNALEQRDGRYGLQTMCEGGGMANATIIERLG